jgi:hypothetical protein
MLRWSLRERGSMVFVRAKNVGGRNYYQLVDNYRLEGSKTPRRRILLHLGRYDTVEGALKGWPRGDPLSEARCGQAPRPVRKRAW